MKDGFEYTWSAKRIYGLEHIWIDIMLRIPLLGFVNINIVRYLELNFTMGQWCCLDGVEVGHVMLNTEGTNLDILF